MSIPIMDYIIRFIQFLIQIFLILFTMSIFSKVANKAPKSSTFNMSYDRKLSGNFGELIPIHCQEVIPGDKISINPQHMTRMAPMLAPIMHEVNVFIHYFFVPNRIIWKNWEPFITGGESGLDAHLLPTVVNLPVTKGSLADHLGLPLTEGRFAVGRNNQLDDRVSLLPFIAYNKIYDEYYRDENLIPAIFKDGNGNTVDLFKDGNQDYSNSPVYFRELFNVKKRAWHHDYFTSALPFAQKGNAVKIPIFPQGNVPLTYDMGSQTTIKDMAGNPAPNKDLRSDINGNLQNVDGQPLSLDPSKNLKLNMTEQNTSTINDLSRAFRLQEWLQKNARAGSRYAESILSFFGVKTSDGRLQRPEFLGGNKQPIMISEVLQQSSTDQTTPQGNMSGHGISIGKSGGFSRFFEEHGYVIGIMSIVPKTSYSQGIPRHFSKYDKFDYFWPQFEHIGEQPILNKEIFAKRSDNYDTEGVFGYVPRYSEYKYQPSTVHGDFKDSLYFWHLGRIFQPDAPPKLNKSFVECSKDPLQRIFAVEDPLQDKFYIHLYQDIKAIRKMSYFGDPAFRI
ncbi:major capsid protein [Elizabethkingia miricola]|uniref:major capsid protein n=1 Tax=Elizabethkingia miricola TaxID=172045 RepID=UPI0038925A0F